MKSSDPDRIQKLFHSRDRVILTIIDLDGTIRVSQGAGLAALGLKDGELVGHSVFHLAHDNPENIELINRALAGEAVNSVISYSGRWLEVQLEPIRDQAGKLVSVGGVVIDVTDKEKRIRQQRFALEAARELSRMDNLEQTLQKVARNAIPVLCDYCAIDVVDGAGRLTRVALAHADLQKEDTAFELLRNYSFEPEVNYPTFRVFNSGKAEIHKSLTSDELATKLHGGANAEIFRKLGVRSALVLPLEVRERRIGVLVLTYCDSNRNYDDEEVELAWYFARCMALSVENYRLSHRKN